MHTRPLSADGTAIQDCIEIPGLGVLPVNAFFLGAAQPLLVDTGLPAARGRFLAALGELIDPADLAPPTGPRSLSRGPGCAWRSDLTPSPETAVSLTARGRRGRTRRRR